MSATPSSAEAHQDHPVRVDAALQQVIDLLELVRQEEAVMHRLATCVGELQSIRHARRALLDLTDAEVDEGRAALALHQDAVSKCVGLPEGARS